MALTLYRRHRKECEGQHPEDFRSGQFDEGRRGWKKCACMIHASGTLAGQFKRKNTQQSEWAQAVAVARKLESANSWAGEALMLIASPPVLPSPNQMTIAGAVGKFMLEQAETLAPNTLRKYKTILAKLTAHSDSKGFVLLEQWTPSDVREFRSDWTVSPVTSAKNMAAVKAFFEFAVGNRWLSQNPARPVKNVRGHDVEKERVPFTDDELKRMFEACATKYGKQEVKWSRTIHHKPASGDYVRYNYKWTGQDLADFISVSVYTGLRISDVCLFCTDRLLESGECHIRTTKTGRKVYTWIPQWLQDRIRAREAERGPAIFGEHTTSDLNVVTDVWRRKLKRLWALCGPWPETPTPHRFRHTFARILLQRANVSVRDVAELLGDTEEVVRKHYASWVPERQARITKLLKEAFEDKPIPHELAIR